MITTPPLGGDTELGLQVCFACSCLLSRKRCDEMAAWMLEQVDEDVMREIGDALLLSPLEARLLMTRGVDTFEAGNRFLSPSIDALHDPFLFSEMRQAASLLHRAITSGDLILVHGDYDADGICGTALLYERLRKLGANVQYFIPDRARDGYGLARRVMERGLDVGFKMVVSVDCGSSDRELIARCAANGVRVIVTDHHETHERIPEAAAFINPKLPGERYPFKELAGSGVAFKLLQGLERVMGINLSLMDQLDLVAIGTLGDYTILRDESRALVSEGLDLLRTWRRPGLKALQAVSGLPPDGFSARQVCFTIVPRINSPGRIGSARDVVELLLTDDIADASRMAAEIEVKNKKRRAHDSRVTEEASYLADIVVKRNEPSALVFSSSSWHEGVVGIGAARLAERYNLPSVLIAVKNGVGKGSARSAGLVNIKQALERCAVYLDEFGGHREAGGFSIREERIADFQRMFEKAVEEMVEGTDAGDVLRIDAEAVLDECTLDLVAFIERLAPFGPGNPEPVLLVGDLKVLPGTRIVGDGHLKIAAVGRSGATGDLIAFTMGKRWPPEEIIGRRVDALVHVRKNVYMGRVTPQLNVTALRYTGESV
jgi:single-stranded-DNA-specific exonuclease